MVYLIHSKLKSVEEKVLNLQKNIFGAVVQLKIVDVVTFYKKTSYL